MQLGFKILLAMALVQGAVGFQTSGALSSGAFMVSPAARKAVSGLSGPTLSLRKSLPRASSGALSLGMQEEDVPFIDRSLPSLLFPGPA